MCVYVCVYVCVRERGGGGGGGRGEVFVCVACVCACVFVCLSLSLITSVVAAFNSCLINANHPCLLPPPHSTNTMEALFHMIVAAVLSLLLFTPGVSCCDFDSHTNKGGGERSQHLEPKISKEMGITES